MIAKSLSWIYKAIGGDRNWTLSLWIPNNNWKGVKCLCADWTFREIVSIKIFNDIDRRRIEQTEQENEIDTPYKIDICIAIYVSGGGKCMLFDMYMEFKKKS